MSSLATVNEHSPRGHRCALTQSFVFFQPYEVSATRRQNACCFRILGLLQGSERPDSELSALRGYRACRECGSLVLKV